MTIPKPNGIRFFDAADAMADYSGRPRRSGAGLGKNLRRRPDGRWLWHWDPAFMRRSVPDVMAQIQIRTEAAAAGIRVPTLLLRGALSDVVSTDGADRLANRIPQIHYRVIEGAAHMIAGDRNDAFIAEILTFLARASPLPRSVGP